MGNGSAKLLYVVLLFVSLLTSSCGGGGGSTPTTPSPGTSANGGSGSTPGTASGSPGNPPVTGTAHRFAYVAGSTGGVAHGYIRSVFAYNVDADTGRLDLINITELGGRSVGLALAAHPSGKFLYAMSNAIRQIWAFKIDPATGALSLIGEPGDGTETILSGGGKIGVDPSGQFVYASDNSQYDTTINNSSGDTRIYKISGSGELTQTGVVPGAEFIPRLMHPSGKFTYLAEPGGVRAYRINAASGDLDPMGPLQPIALGALEPTGRFAYGISSDRSLLTAYSVSADGSLTPIGSAALEEEFGSL
jgi:hypothetical protein